MKQHAGGATLAFAALMLVAPQVVAQQPLPPLPPPGPGSAGGAGSAGNVTTGGDSSTTPTPNASAASSPSSDARAPAAAPSAAAGPPLVGYEVAPPVLAVHPAVLPPIDETHAPMFSLWVGGSLGALGYGGYLYDNEQNKKESTGNFAGPGLGVEVDIGARLGRRYVPYVFLQHGFMTQGHRFEGTDATSASDMYGLGFRYTAGDVDTAGFLTELSIGIRTITVSGGGQTYKMSALEYFRLGLGAEIRISTLFVISPMAHVSGGAMDNTSGTIAFSPEGSRDGVREPTYRNGDPILVQRGYVAVGIGCGAHFDIFGK